MAKNKDTVRSSNKGMEKSILSALKDITHSDSETYFILWKYAPELLPCGEIKSFEELQQTYKNFEGRTEQSFEKALFKEDVQEGIKYLLQRLDGKRDIDLLNKYYSLAMEGDVQALKAYMNFKKTFFADNETSELKTLLDNINISNADDSDDFEMDL